MYVVGNVTSTTLDLPDFGEEGLVSIPTGEHDIVLDASATGDVAWVLMNMENGDDGGEEDDLPQDVNGDCIVNVNDLLEIIGSWGETCP